MLAFHMFGYRQTRTAHPACPETRGTHSEARRACPQARSKDSRSLLHHVVTSSLLPIPLRSALFTHTKHCEPNLAEPLPPTSFPSITSHICTYTLAPATPLQSSGYFTTPCTPSGVPPKSEHPAKSARWIPAESTKTPVPEHVRPETRGTSPQAQAKLIRCFLTSLLP